LLGGNGDRQLGDDTTDEAKHTPVAVQGLNSGVTAISAGDDHTCALTTSSGVLCWGSNEHSQLGDGTEEDRKTPVAVQGLNSGVIAISAGVVTPML
jgi:alpha-tubulin suppressor-like RCC1 family protein